MATISLLIIVLSVRCMAASICPSKAQAQRDCPPGLIPICYYGDADDCSKFYECDYRNSESPTAVLLQCPSGDVSSEAVRTCVPPFLGTCSSDGQEIKARGQRSLPVGRATTNAHFTRAPPVFECPEGDIADTGCQGPRDCLYANPDNCNAFI